MNEIYMDKEDIKNKIEKLLGDYKLLKDIAIRMDTKNVKIKYEDWFHNYPIGIIISELDFDSEYIKSNIHECFIKAKLYDFACSEEFIWFTSSNGMSQEKQDYFLDNFKDAVIIEIGGCYSCDYECYIISEKKLFVVNYGIWD